MYDMYDIIKNMIRQAYEQDNYDLIENIRQLIYEFADTINCPSNWQDIGERLAQEYDCDTWIYKELGLWNYED